MTRTHKILFAVSAALVVAYVFRDKLLPVVNTGLGALKLKPISLAPAVTRTQQVVDQLAGRQQVFDTSGSFVP